MTNMKKETNTPFISSLCDERQNLPILTYVADTKVQLIVHIRSLAALASHIRYFVPSCLPRLSLPLPSQITIVTSAFFPICVI